MTERPEEEPVGTGAGPEPEGARAAGTTQPDGERPTSPAATPKVEGLAGWHEPTAEAGSTRPVVVETWFTPPDAIPAEPSAPAPREAAAPQAGPSAGERGELPATAPAQEEAWYTPLDSQLDELLAGAAETIVETHAPEAPAEPATPTESTPASGSTPPQPTAGAPVAVQAEGVVEPAASAGETGVQAEGPVEPVARPEPELSRFEEVERKVKILREQYQAGLLTRDQLQSELRSLMILGDDGHWWMLGLETDRWYYFDGRSWIPATPPGYDQRVRGSAVRTETGLQQVVGETSVGLAGGEEGVEVDEDGVPLPRRVPQEDPSATLVSPRTPFLEPVRASDAPTQQKARQVEIDAALAGVIAHPAGSAAAAGDEQTMRSQVAGAGATIPRGALAGAAGAQAGRPTRPKPPIGEFPQPDYSEALGPSYNRNTYVKWGIRFSVFAVIGGMALTLLALLLMIGYYFYKVDQYAEAVAGLRTRAADFETTLILDDKGATLAEFSNFTSADTGQRKSVALNQISPWLIHATVSTENETFYSDPGFSVFAIVRAAYQNVRQGGTVSGASTITQQLARALVLETEFASQRTAERKIVEIIVASEIKRKYTKNEILEIYLNEIFYGNLAYGAEAAAQTYFNKSAADLNPAEAAFLAGLPQSPATYDPVVNREAAIARMHTVLRLMSEANGTGCISIEHDDATRWGVPNGGGLCISAVPQPDGSSLYYYQAPGMAEPQELVLEIALVETAPFRPPEFRATHPHFVNYVWQQLEETYGPQAIYSAGFRVYTTLNENIQSIAEGAVASQLAALQARGIDATNASVVVMRPSDGAVLAMVGSADYYNEDIDGQVNIAFTAQQPGSAIKPFVYLTAFMPDEQGHYLTPASVLWDVYSDFGGYVPVNYDRQYHGPKSVREALGNSLNVPAVKALNAAGLLRFTELATRMGLRFPLGNPVERQAGLPTALGAVEVRLFDMVSAFSTLARNGRRVDPYSIVYIEDSKGNQVYRASSNPAGEQVVPAEYAYLVTSILADNNARAEEFGRGWPMELQGGRAAAIKTGTSNDSRDVWALGYTPQLTVGVWVGNSDNRPMVGLTGYYGAAPIWNEVMEGALAGQPFEQFAPPAGLIQMEVCADSGAQPSPACAGRTRLEIFAAAAPPPGPAQDIYRTIEVDGFTGRLVNQYCSDEIQRRTFLSIDDPTAYNWLNNDPAGREWLSQRGLQAPIMPPPTEYCSPNEPRPYVVVSNPSQDATVQGVIQLMGTVTMPNFSRYEVRYGISHQPQAFSEPLYVEPNQRPDPNSLLGQFDTGVLQNGPYTLRLVVIDIYGRYVTRDIRINVNNVQVPPAFPTPTVAPTLTPFGPEPVATQPFGEIFPTPTLAPTMTPTWTLTPTPG